MPWCQKLAYGAKVADGAKRFLAEGTVTFINRPANLPNRTLANAYGWMIWDNRGLLSFVSVDILLGKAFVILVFCLFVRNN